MAVPTTDQLRDNIDRGLTGEKVAVPDPATAPLGTDAEAGGSPASAQERALAAASSPHEPRQGPALPGGLVYLFLVFILAIAVITVVVLAAS